MPQPSTKPMSSCDFFDEASACIAVAVYFVPLPSGSMLTTAVNGRSGAG
jgi:hypothetical protein